MKETLPSQADSLNFPARREVLWNGNRETWRGQFFSRDSLFLYALTSRKKHHQTYPALLAQAEYAHLQVYRQRSPRDTDRWLQTLQGV
ncbi:MAG: hypothetical protein IPG51_14325 [Chloroflexi bacterium]|nr:hypothetical protein [Chloroflexota bacterium]